VRLLEQSVIQLLTHYGIDAHGRCDAPGVYVHDAKICSIGLRVRKNCTYHGIALNVAMDLSPFSDINPCGFKQLQMTQMSHWVPTLSTADVLPNLVTSLQKNFGFQSSHNEIHERSSQSIA
jgi:lipoyl(octanoyl) transferase